MPAPPRNSCRRSKRFDADVTVTRGAETVGGTSIMGLMMLAAGPGTSITIEAQRQGRRRGDDAICELVGGRFGEDD